MKKIALVVLGGILAALGGLWMLQGLGAVVVSPILCFAECEALEGPSITWAVIGAVVLGTGLLTLALAFRRRRPK